jgi:hypothetical protein
MEQSDLLRRVVDIIEQMGLPHLVTGSMATVLYGEPRWTNDIDIDLDLPVARAPEFCRHFPLPDYCVCEDAARQAATEHGQFNIIHPGTGLKIDVMVPADTPFNKSRFARSQRVQPEPGYSASFASPEDVIIKKMEYYREGGSEKHLRDIAGVMRITGERLDRDYIAQWAVQLRLDEIW